MDGRVKKKDMNTEDLESKIYDLENKLNTLQTKHDDLMAMFYSLEADVRGIEMGLKSYVETIKFLDRIKHGLNAKVQ